ncbi:MAG: DUF5050 domain-containing protein [Oscillospiraceae bacterium]|nr:DUF5050 domain-containing protein [Oscillospiraceae bacterium]
MKKIAKACAILLAFVIILGGCSLFNEPDPPELIPESTAASPSTSAPQTESPIEPAEEKASGVYREPMETLPTAPWTGLASALPVGLIGNTYYADGFAQDDANIYSVGRHGITIQPKDGGAQRIVPIQHDLPQGVIFAQNLYSPVAYANGYLYFTLYNQSSREDGQNGFFRTKLDGTGTERLFESEPNGLYVRPSQMQVVEDKLYFVNNFIQIYSLDLKTMALQELAQGDWSSEDISGGISYCIADGKLYYSQALRPVPATESGRNATITDSVIMQADMDGKNAKQITKVPGELLSLEVQSGTLYFSVCTALDPPDAKTYSYRLGTDTSPILLADGELICAANNGLILATGQPAYYQAGFFFYDFAAKTTALIPGADGFAYHDILLLGGKAYSHNADGKIVWTPND